MNSYESARLRALYKYAILDTPPEPNFDRITDLAASIFDLPFATLSLADANRHWFKARHGVEATEMPRRMSFCDETLRAEGVFAVPDALADVRFQRAPGVAGPPHFRFYVGAPLVTPAGMRIGSLCVLDTVPHPEFDTRNADILTNLSGTAVELLEARARQTELARCTEEIARLAGHDPLTGLPNRRLLGEHVEEMLARIGDDEQIAVLYVDLDRFKSVNDRYGHAAGDLLLQQVAARLRASVRETDRIARLGGDEFAVVLNGSQARLQAADVADRLIRALSALYMLEGRTVRIGASVGIAVGTNTGCGWPEPDAMFRHADTALIQAKAGGRGTYCFFERGMTLPS